MLEIQLLMVELLVDGKIIEVWMLLLLDFDVSKFYLLILEIYGGLYMVYGFNFSVEIQLMVVKGYIVVWLNLCGSILYGEDFVNLIYYNYLL